MLHDKKAIRRIKNNEASRRYRARMREKRKEWADKLRDREDSNSKSPDDPQVFIRENSMLFHHQTQIETQPDKFNNFSFNSLFRREESRESRESSLDIETIEPDVAEKFVKKQLYKISRREKNNIAVRKYRHKRKQRIEQNKKELLYLSSHHQDLLKEVEMLKKQMSVLLAFEGIADNELLRAVSFA